MATPHSATADRCAARGAVSARTRADGAIPFNVLPVLTAEGARARSYGLRVDDGTGAGTRMAPLAVLRFDDALRRTEAGWRVVRRDTTLSQGTADDLDRVTVRRNPDLPRRTASWPAAGLERDRIEVEDLMLTYAHSLDEGDAEGFAALFEHGVWIGQHGSAAARQYLEKNHPFVDGSLRSLHALRERTIVVDRDSATAESVHELYRADPSGRVSLAGVNDYNDRFERHDGRWRFVSRELTRRAPEDWQLRS